VIGAAEVPQQHAAPMYLTILQAAELVGVDEKTLGRWSREDPTFPRFSRGRVVRIPRERFLAWLERQTRRPRASRGASGAQESAAVA
jgi:excisionase family DNA binding protein